RCLSDWSSDVCSSDLVRSRTSTFRSPVMLCSSCGDVLQPHATSCINLSCADYRRPFTAEELHANRPRPPEPTAPMRPLDGPANEIGRASCREGGWRAG